MPDPHPGGPLAIIQHGTGHASCPGTTIQRTAAAKDLGGQAAAVKALGASPRAAAAGAAANSRLRLTWKTSFKPGAARPRRRVRRQKRPRRTRTKRKGGGGFAILVALLAVGVLAWIGSTGWYIVEVEEVGVVRRLGRIRPSRRRRVFILKLPAPFERADQGACGTGADRRNRLRRPLRNGENTRDLPTKKA